MNKNFSRIIVGSLLGVAFLTVLMILLKTNALLWAGYIWSIWALVTFAIAMGFWATGSKLKYILYAAYPQIVSSYLIATVLITLFFCGLSYAGFWTIPWGWFCLIEFAVLAITVWKLQAVDTAKDEILVVEEKIKLNTVDWKMLIADISAVVDKTAGSDKKIVERAFEAIRFADSVTHSAVRGIEENIKNRILELDDLAESGNSEKIADNCAAIERLVKERATKLMLLK